MTTEKQLEANRENAAIARRNLKDLAGIKVINKAVLNCDGRVTVEQFPREPAGENTGGSAVRLDRAGQTQAISLDKVLLAQDKGLAPRQGRAYREIFQLVRAQLSGENARPEQDDGSYDPRQA